MASVSQHTPVFETSPLAAIQKKLLLVDTPHSVRKTTQLCFVFFKLIFVSINCLTESILLPSEDITAVNKQSKYVTSLS